MKTIRLTVAQALVKFLDNQYLAVDGKEIKFIHGVFGIFGHGCVVGMGEALQEKNHNLKFYQGHSEQGMGHAAMAFAKQHNRQQIMAAVSSIGPGALNLITAAGTATVNRIPVLFLPGDTFACRQPDPVLQQVEQTHDYTITANDAFRAVCRYWDRVVRPEQLMTATLNAMRVLTDPAKAGAVCIALPQDVQGEAYNYPEYYFAHRIHRLGRRPLSQGAAARAAGIISGKKKPMVVCGGGVKYSGAEAELKKLAIDHGIPFGETQAGKGALTWDAPLNLGGMGLTGTVAANCIAEKADLIIAVGTRLADFTTSSKWQFKNPDCQILSINVCAFDAAKMNAEYVIGDAKLALQDIMVELGSYKADWGDLPAREIEKWNNEADRLFTMPDNPENNGERGLSQTRVLGIINEGGSAEDAIVVTASGSLPSDLQRIWRTRAAGCYHVEYGFSCMGYEIAGALGAKIACPDREVYSIIGDGAFWMLNSELYTAVQENLKIIVILIDNNGYQCIDNLETSQGIPHFGCEFRYRNEESGQLDGAFIPIDYAKIAEGIGMAGYRADTSEKFAKALAAARAEKRSVLIDCKVARKSMTGNSGGWWRVGVPEVSPKRAVVTANRKMAKEIANTWVY